MRGAVGGIAPIATTSRHNPFSEFENIDFERSYGHFGPINKCLEALILDTGFRYLLALNGRNFGINAHLAANPTLCPVPPVEGTKSRGLA